MDGGRLETDGGRLETDGERLETDGGRLETDGGGGVLAAAALCRGSWSGNVGACALRRRADRGGHWAVARWTLGTVRVAPSDA